MKRRALNTLILTLLTSGQLLMAQDEPITRVNEREQFQMIKSTLEFLATDEKVFPRTKGGKCDNCQAYPDLTQYIRNNGLTGAGELVSSAQTEARRLLQSQTDQPLVKLRDYLIRRVTEGSSRAHRKQLPNYAAYTSQLNQIVADAGEQTTATDEPTTPSATVEALDAAGGDPAPATTAALAQDDAPTGPETEGEKPFYGLLALILGIINSALIALLFLRNRKPAPGEPTLGGNPVADLEDKVFQLETERATILSRLKALEGAAPKPVNTPLAASPAPVNERPVQLHTPQARTFPVDPASEPSAHPERVAAAAPEHRSMPVSEPSAGRAIPDPQAPDLSAENINRTVENRFLSPEPVPPVSPARETAAPPANRMRPVSSLFYARMADLGDGFSAGGLLQAPDRDTVFEIQQLNETTAAYRVSENPELQRLALSDPYSYLNDTCAYLTQPRPDSRIRTEQPGRLTLQGDKWLITQKAQISFT